MEEYPVTMHYSRVRQLMRKIPGQSTPGELYMPSKETRELRAKLILEEAIETCEALGVEVSVRGVTPYGMPDNIILDMSELIFETTLKPNLVEIADGCADISVVTMGTLVACGIPDVELLRLVDENNLAKFGPGSYLREDGKWVKPPDHKPPDIAGYLSSLAGTWN